MSFKAMKPWVWAVNIIVWALPIGSYFSRRFSLRQILAGAIVGALFTLVWVIVGALIFALKGRKLYGSPRSKTSSSPIFKKRRAERYRFNSIKDQL